MACRSFIVRSVLAVAFVAPAARAPAQEPPQKPAPAATPAAAEAPKAVAAKPGFESFAPKETLFFVGADSVDQLRTDWDASPWGRLLADPSNEALRKSIARLMSKIGATMEKETGVDLVDASQRMTGRFGVATFGGAETKGDSWGFTLGAESDEHIAELRTCAQKLLDHWNEKGKLVLKTETEGDVEVTLAVMKDAETDVPDLRIGAAGTVLLVDGAAGKFRDKPNFQNAVAALKGEGKESLATLPSFKESRAARPGGVKAWFDTGALIRARFAAAHADKAEKKEEEGEGADFDTKLMGALGMDELGPLSARLDVNAKEMRFEALQAWSGKGLLVQLLNAWLSGSDFSLLQFIPADAEHALAVHVDFAKGMEASAAIEKAVMGAAGAPDPADGAGAGADPNAPPDADAPLDPKKDFMDHLDGRIAFYIANVDASEALPLPGMDKPRGFCVALGVKSAEPLRASLDKVLRSMGLHAARKKSEFQGFQVYSIPVTPLTVHYAILDDVAVVSTSLTMLQDVLRRKSDKELKNLAGDASFKREFEGLSPGASLVVWSRADPSVFSTIGAPFAGHDAADRPSAHRGGKDGGEAGEDGGAKADGAASPSLEETLEGELHDFLEALGTVDPAVAAKHLPAGSVIGLGASATGLHLEGVSR